ncbi:MAG: response regulator [Burkholderiaceae bacterium]
MRVSYASNNQVPEDAGPAFAETRPMAHVLVVDDERDTLIVLEQALASFGYHVTTANNGADAIEKAASWAPDAVVTDLLMPFIDGIGLAKALRSNPQTAGVKIVLCSGVPEDNVRALFDGYDAFMHKPFTIELLRDILGALLPQPAY